jgi:hypothetical protein
LRRFSVAALLHLRDCAATSAPSVQTATKSVVLRGGAEHGRAADVDVLDAVVEAAPERLTVASNG